MLKKRIPENENKYPLNDPTYPVAHMLTSKEEIHKFGKKPYEELNTIAKMHPHELLGTHNPSGSKRYVSSIVPVRLRKEVEWHEKREPEWMRKLKKR